MNTDEHRFRKGGRNHRRAPMHTDSRGGDRPEGTTILRFSLPATARRVTGRRLKAPAESRSLLRRLAEGGEPAGFAPRKGRQVRQRRSAMGKRQLAVPDSCERLPRTAHCRAAARSATSLLSTLVRRRTLPHEIRSFGSPRCLSSAWRRLAETPDEENPPSAWRADGRDGRGAGRAGSYADHQAGVAALPATGSRSGTTAPDGRRRVGRDVFSPPPLRSAAGRIRSTRRRARTAAGTGCRRCGRWRWTFGPICARPGAGPVLVIGDCSFATAPGHRVLRYVAATVSAAGGRAGLDTLATTGATGCRWFRRCR